jgi:hypothetical protein
MITPRPSEWDAFGAYDVGRGSRLSDAELAAAHERESVTERYGRAARRLLEEIDAYLEFFAIARTA